MEKTKITLSSLRKRTSQFHPTRPAKWGYTPSGWNNYLPSNRPQPSTLTTWRCPDPNTKDKRFWCKKNFNRSGQLSWPFTDVDIQENGATTICPRESRADTVRIQRSINNFPRGHCVTYPDWPNHPKCAVLISEGFVPFQRHHGMHMAS